MNLFLFPESTFYLSFIIPICLCQRYVCLVCLPDMRGRFCECQNLTWLKDLPLWTSPWPLYVKDLVSRFWPTSWFGRWRSDDEWAVGGWQSSSSSWSSPRHCPCCWFVWGYLPQAEMFIKKNLNLWTRLQFMFMQGIVLRTVHIKVGKKTNCYMD